MLDTLEAKAEVIKALDSIDVCQICQLRITGSPYDDTIVDETHSKMGSHCCVCLGILEAGTLISLTKKVAEKLKDYDSSTFNIGISIPQCVLLRQTSVNAHLIDQGFGTADCAAVKAVVKFFLVKSIKALSNKEPDNHSELIIKLDFNYPGNIKEISVLDPLLKASHSSGKKRNRTGSVLNQHRAELAVKDLSNHSVKKYMQCPPHAITNPCACDVSVCHNSVYIGGRYNKYSRTLSQTPWFIDGFRRGDSSVLELIGEPLKEFTGGDDMKFQSSGREDIDVRMLGTGRPFAVEVINPKKIITQSQLEKLEATINASTDMISVRQLQLVTKAGLEMLKKGEEEKRKTYTAKLWCPGKINDEMIKSISLMKDIELKQKTPLRVLHRRPLATRVRIIHEITLKNTNEPEYYELEVVTQAGTYVKELVHGDLGRTEPSLRTLLSMPIDIVELDVMSIHVDWPPEKNNTVNTEESKPSGKVIEV